MTAPQASEEGKIRLVVTMAGEYQRFKSFSSNVPKYLLPFEDSLVFDEVIALFDHPETIGEIGFIANELDIKFKQILLNRIDKMAVQDTRLVFVPTTSSQVETAQVALEMFGWDADESHPLLFHNIDTVLRNRNLAVVKDALASHDGYVDCFFGNNPGYSYVVADEGGTVQLIKEKVVISDHACTGLYGFSNAKLFSEVCEEFDPDPARNFSEVFERAISLGRTVASTYNPHQKDTIVLGTPEEYLSEI